LVDLLPSLEISCETTQLRILLFSFVIFQLLLRSNYKLAILVLKITQQRTETIFWYFSQRILLMIIIPRQSKE